VEEGGSSSREGPALPLDQTFNSAKLVQEMFKTIEGDIARVLHELSVSRSATWFKAFQGIRSGLPDTTTQNSLPSGSVSTTQRTLSSLARRTKSPPSWRARSATSSGSSA
jgi:hypothetical protein